ncbi:11-beta-hydroxysteroid dehydrogenase [Dirofilaria immitis]
MSAMRSSYLLTLIILCTITVLSSAHHFRPYIISGWPIMIGDEDQRGIPDDIHISKMPDSISKRFYPGWNALQNQLRNQ